MKTEDATHKVGAGIILTFTPLPDLPPGRIGLVQTIRHDLKDTAVDTPNVVWKALNDKEEWEDKLLVDSPVYGALRDPDKPLPRGLRSLEESENPRDTLGKWKTPAHKSVSKEKVASSNAYANESGIEHPPQPNRKVQTGLSPDGEAEAVPAALSDTPGFGVRSNAASEAWTWEVEVAALGLSDDLKSHYLGSIRWGWQYEPPLSSDPTSATLAPDKIERVSDGSPSEDFMKAAFNWNTQAVADPETNNKVDLVQLPIPSDLQEVLSDARTRTDFDGQWERIGAYLDLMETGAGVIAPSERIYLVSLQRYLLRGVQEIERAVEVASLAIYRLDRRRLDATKQRDKKTMLEARVLMFRGYLTRIDLLIQ